MRVLVVCNPISGGGRAGRLGPELRELLASRGHSVELWRTGRAGDARERVSRVDSDLDRIVVVGGDGTINEVVNGLPDPAAIPLTQLATGTANLLAHELRLPYSASAMAQLLGNGSIRRLDLGLVSRAGDSTDLGNGSPGGGRRFLMVASAGFDAMVTLESQGRRRGPMNYARWVPSIVRVARRYRPPRLRVQVDDGRPVEGELVIVSNVRNYGGVFTAADRASCDSGHLDVCVLTRAGLPALARAAVHALLGGLSGTRGVVYLTGERIRVASEDPVPVEIDGDPGGTTPIEISVRPRVVPVVVP